MRRRETAWAGTDRNRIIDWLVFAMLLAAASAVTFTLFHRQTLGNPGWYHSDMKAYILEMQGLESKYSFPYPVFFKFAALIHLFADPELSVALATMLLNSLGMVVTKIAFNRLALRDLEGAFGCRKRPGIPGGSGADSSKSHDLSWLAGILISLGTISLFFVSMVYPPEGIYLPGIKYKYLGVFTANPFHNATYMAARPFAILAFLWFVKLLPSYEKGLGRGIERPGKRTEEQEKETGRPGKRTEEPERETGRPGKRERDAEREREGGPGLVDYGLFSFFLLIATMTKPSFTLVMVSTAGLLMLYRLIRSGFRNFVPTACLGLCFIPTFADLLYQYKGVFVPGGSEERGLGFCLGEVWAAYCENIPLAVGLAVGFPLLVLLLNFRECRKNSLLLFSWQLYLVSFAEAFFLYEKGFRKWDFNFSWGYMCGIFFCHFGALAVLLQVTARETEKLRSGEPGGRRKMLFLALQWLAYLWHVACGILYFGVFMSGAMYY